MSRGAPANHELKAVSKLAEEHRAQVLNYLHAAKLELGLLVNFGHYPKLEYDRIALTRHPTFRVNSRDSRATLSGL